MMRQRCSTFQSRAFYLGVQFRADARSGEIYYISVACLNGFLILCAAFSCRCRTTSRHFCCGAPAGESRALHGAFVPFHCEDGVAGRRLFRSAKPGSSACARPGQALREGSTQPAGDDIAYVEKNLVETPFLASSGSARGEVIGGARGHSRAPSPGRALALGPGRRSGVAPCLTDHPASCADGQASSFQVPTSRCCVLSSARPDPPGAPCADSARARPCAPGTAPIRQARALICAYVWPARVHRAFPVCCVRRPARGSDLMAWGPAARQERQRSSLCAKCERMPARTLAVVIFWGARPWCSDRAGCVTPSARPPERGSMESAWRYPAWS